MPAKTTKLFSFCSFLLAATLISGCNDGGSSVNQFGTGALTGSQLEEELPPTIQFDDISILPNEFFAGDFAFSSAAAKVWIEAEHISGPSVEIYFIDALGLQDWENATGGNTIVPEDINLSSFVFASTYPELEASIPENFYSEKATVTTGFYRVLIENTDAGKIKPEHLAEPTVLNLRLYAAGLSEDSAPEVRVIKLSKVRIMNSGSDGQ